MNGVMMLTEDLDKIAENRMNAKLEIIRLWTEFEKSFAGGKTVSKAFFCFAYNRGHIEALAWVKNTIQTISQASLMRWARHIEQKNLFRLAGRYGSRKKSGVFYANLLLQDYVHTMISMFPNCSARQILRGISANLQLFKLKQPPSLKTVARFMGDWKAQAEPKIERVKRPGKTAQIS
ncbi:MAG: hypothetical protein A2W80_13745 [Candidatus Riflebacteria bacterium GWC2_50_8]|nr:MAG: hypothetical protein A2W80_13745 [Candidatus Riflebacteria bacterium GWC2_50_8]